MYKVVSGSRGVRRSFSISCGLQEGYGAEGKTHRPAEAVSAALEFMKSRAASGRAYLTGTVSTGEVVYAWPEGEGKAGGGSEPSVVFNGEVSPLYNADMSNEEAVEILNDLAASLGAALGQTRVYITFCDEIWILQREESATPTGEKV